MSLCPSLLRKVWCYLITKQSSICQYKANLRRLGCKFKKCWDALGRSWDQMFWLRVSNSMCFVSPVQESAKWEDTWTADRTWPGKLAANTTTSLHSAVVTFPLTVPLFSTHGSWDLVICPCQLFTPVPPVCSLVSDPETEVLRWQTLSAKLCRSNLHSQMLWAIQCPDLLTCKQAFKLNRSNPCWTRKS